MQNQPTESLGLGLLYRLQTSYLAGHATLVIAALAIAFIGTGIQHPQTLEHADVTTHAATDPHSQITMRPLNSPTVTRMFVDRSTESSFSDGIDAGLAYFRGGS